MRLDEHVAGLGYDLLLARALIMEGRVLINERVESRPGVALRPRDQVRLRLPQRMRGYRKLEGILASAGLDPAGRICLDIGAAHGGFSRMLLEKGAAFIYAIDVAYGQLAFELRKRENVVVLERSHIKDISETWFKAEHCAGPFFITSDVSFLSLRSVLQALQEYKNTMDARSAWEGLFLFKPQFERSDSTISGILPEEDSLQARQEFHGWLEAMNIQNKGAFAASLRGKKGNQEYFYHLQF
jgi:23S rRNA (cytidine1920-2'-O)/16S rRNA (cytidine1409-2'-O)-methyltransferase